MIEMEGHLQSIIFLQKHIRGYLSRKNILIPSAYYQTKIWRRNRSWYKNGKSNECEKYQIKTIEKITGITLYKTDDRMCFETNEIYDIRHPNKQINGYDISENFDGKVFLNDNTIYFNLKFVCDKGGSQTRTLREVYHFIKCQLDYLVSTKNHKTYFINILDGDTTYENIDKFMYLSGKDKYKRICEYMFIGSLQEFQKIKNNFGF